MTSTSTRVDGAMNRHCCMLKVILMRGHPEWVATQMEALRHNKHKHRWAIAGWMQCSR